MLFIKRFSSLPRAAKRETFALGVFLVSAFLLSLGPRIQITDGAPTIAGPYSILSFLPGFHSLRSLARSSIFVVFALVTFASMGWAPMFERMRSMKRWVVSGFLAGAVIFELVLTPFVPVWVERAPRFADLPPVYTWIREHHESFTMIELPIGKNVLIEGRYTYASAFHGMKMVNGYSGHFPDTFQDAMKIMPGFPNDASIEFLRALNVDLVVLHKDLFSPEEWERITRELSATPFLLLYSDDHDRIVDVRL